MSALDWVIVGGGPHGVCAARALQSVGADLRIVEPTGTLLDRWAERARSVAMTSMRSPVSHHLDTHPSDLDHFLHRRDNDDVSQLARPLRRPTHAAFLRHCEHVIAGASLQDAVVPGRVQSLRCERGQVIVAGPGVELRTRRVLLATGSNRMRRPLWADELREQAPGSTTCSKPPTLDARHRRRWHFCGAARPRRSAKDAEAGALVDATPATGRGFRLRSGVDDQPVFGLVVATRINPAIVVRQAQRSDRKCTDRPHPSP